MKRIVRRKYGKEQFQGSNHSPTHLIKIGIKVRAWSNKRNTEVDFPSPVNGFYIVRNTRDAAGFVIAPPEGVRGESKVVSTAPIDWALMQALGHKREQVERGLRMGKSAPEGLLPQRLEFVLLNDAVAQPDGSWDYSQILAEEYQAFKAPLLDEDARAWNRKNAPGLFCHGNGDCATRRQADGTSRVIPCNPYGKAGVDPKHWCPYSRATNSPCRAKMHLILMLGRRNPNGELVPLAEMHDARFRFDTGSENNAMRVIEELDRVAPLVGGWLSGLTGTLNFSQQIMIRPADSGDGRGEEGGTGLVPQVSFTLNKWAINERVEYLRNRDGRRIAGPVAPVLLPMASAGTPAQLEGPAAPVFWDEEDLADMERAQEPTADHAAEQEPADELPWDNVVVPPAATDAEAPVDPNRTAAAELWDLCELKASTIAGSNPGSWFEYWTRSGANKGVKSIEALFSAEKLNADRHARAMALLHESLEKARRETANLRTASVASGEASA